MQDPFAEEIEIVGELLKEIHFRICEKKEFRNILSQSLTRTAEAAVREAVENAKKELWNKLNVDISESNYFFDTVYKCIGIDVGSDEETVSHPR